MAGIVGGAPPPRLRYFAVIDLWFSAYCLNSRNQGWGKSHSKDLYEDLRESVRLASPREPCPVCGFCPHGGGSDPAGHLPLRASALGALCPHTGGITACWLRCTPGGGFSLEVMGSQASTSGP